MRYLSLALLSALLAACGNNTPEPGAAAPEKMPAATAPSSDAVVNVYNWSDYVAEDTLAQFEKASGIRVVYDVYDANEILEAKLMAGGSGYDVVFPSARPFAERHLKTGVYAPLDRSKLPGFGNLDPAILRGLEDIDPGNAHVVPYMWGTTGLGINVNKVRAALGADVPLDSWDLLFKPELAAKLAACGIAVMDDDQETFGAALIWTGRNPNDHAADEVERVSAIYAGIRPHIRYFNSSKYVDDLANGDLCIAMGYSGDVFQARDRALEAKNGVELAYVIPKEGAMRWIDVIAIPKDAPHLENAHRFIDFLLQPETIAAVSNFVSYANANLPARALLDPALAQDPGVYPPADVAAKLIDPKSLPDDQQRARVRAWTAIKSGL